MRRVLAILCAVAAIAASCGKSPETFVDYVSAVTLSPTDNVLRYRVEATCSKHCELVVEYREAGAQEWLAAQGMTIMFLLPRTRYECRVRVGEGLYSGTMAFTTGELPPGVPEYTLDLDAGGPESGYLMQWQATRPGWLTFCDMQGRVIWYESFEQAVRHVHYDPVSGRIAVLTGFRDGVNSAKFQRLCDRIIVIDLEGNRLVKWTASGENVAYPHHDIKIMPDGNLLIFNAVVRNFDLTPIGGEADTPVWGDGFTVISPGGEVLQEWDVFGEIDPVRDTWLDAVELDYDLLHGNSVAWDSAGDWYVTLNRHSELWKIDGRTGAVLWKVGSHGNVALDGPVPEGGLHSAVPIAPDKVLVYNNGGGDSPRSRAQIYEVDGDAMTARLTLDVAVDALYSSADRSNVELLPDGKTLMFASTLARKCTFTDLDGKPLKVISRTGISYRSHYFETLP